MLPFKAPSDHPYNKHGKQDVQRESTLSEQEERENENADYDPFDGIFQLPALQSEESIKTSANITAGASRIRNDPAGR